ncbi:MAG TPA: type I-U CRISPR-associated protein Csx17, partial [Polyangiaceae bacterium]|nr:type I-U CRISPR-associated protein Csx17 [Polyangiaceae bacterium]
MSNAVRATHPIHEVELTGCRPEPLASYLKALGILRVVAQQKDPRARGCFRGEQFILQSALDRNALVSFFEIEYRPTPVIAPWNGGSGFYPKDNRKAADAIVSSKDARLQEYAETIRIAREFVAAKGWTERPADENKQLMIASMRACLPDSALAWLDAAIVLGNDRVLFPPLLGTGGNDGRLDFSNNFQQRVFEVLTKSPQTPALESSLFGVAQTSQFEGAMGQYQPAANDRTNPWDFILLIEGALLFAAAATRRYENLGSAALAFPFHARAAGGLATVTEGDENESRDELWLPLWTSPASLPELRHLFAEGRATVGAGSNARSASTALDFARAVSSLGVDRGIRSFVRVGFHVRNGLAYYATPLGRFATRQVPAARLLDDIDTWFDRLRRAAGSNNCPARVSLAKRRTEQSLFEAAQTGRLSPVLLELGATERALAMSLGFTQKQFLQPVPRLQSAWSQAVAENSAEQRLGAALAMRVGMRRRLIPLEASGWAFGRADQPDFVFSDRPLVENLHALLLREQLEELQNASPKNRASVPDEICSLSDIAAF